MLAGCLFLCSTTTSKQLSHFKLAIGGAQSQEPELVELACVIVWPGHPLLPIWEFDTGQSRVLSRLLWFTLQTVWKWLTPYRPVRLESNIGSFVSFSAWTPEHCGILLMANWNLTLRLLLCWSEFSYSYRDWFVIIKSLGNGGLLLMVVHLWSCP